MNWLPKVPTLEELERTIPPIPAIPDDARRPFWSVIIPTYNCAHYLRETLSSVLAQDPGPDRMQIEVLDDCSTKDDPEAAVRELAPGRVRFSRNVANQGVSRTFNECLRLSQGRWIHILHGDDRVKPGFYARYEGLMERYPKAVLFYGRVEKIDEQSAVVGESTIAGPPAGGLVENFVARLATENLCFFPSVVASRAAYEAAGGFSTYFGHVADMDMWLRLGLVGDVVYSVDHVADYRVHAASDTNQLIASGGNTNEIFKLSSLNERRFAARSLPPVDPAWRNNLAYVAEIFCSNLADRKHWKGARTQMQLAYSLRPSIRRALKLAKVSARSLFS